MSLEPVGSDATISDERDSEMDDILHLADYDFANSIDLSDRDIEV
jgi:hypothetical protein